MSAPLPSWATTSTTWPMPLTIGVVSDTHIHAEPPGQRLPAVLLRELASANVQLILHAGDIFAPSVLDQLQALAPVLAVPGNGDDAAMRQLLPPSRVITVGPHQIGLVHGHAGTGRNTAERARRTFAAQSDVGCIVFGHTHQPLSRLEAGLILFNPGSPTDKRRQRYFSFGLLRVAETIKPELIYFLP